MRHILSLVGVSVTYKSSSPCNPSVPATRPSTSASPEPPGVKGSIKHAPQLPIAFGSTRSAAAYSKASAAVGVSSQHTGGACSNSEPCPAAQSSVVAAVQLKREELLKVKCAQLERQVSMLAKALQVNGIQSCTAPLSQMRYITAAGLRLVLWGLHSCSVAVPGFSSKHGFIITELLSSFRGTKEAEVASIASGRRHSLHQPPVRVQ